MTTPGRAACARSAVAALLGFREHDGARAARVLGGAGIAGDHHEAVDAPGLAQRCERVLVQQPGQRFPLCGAEQSVQPLLGILRILDGEKS